MPCPSDYKSRTKRQCKSGADNVAIKLEETDHRSAEAAAEAGAVPPGGTPFVSLMKTRKLLEQTWLTRRWHSPRAWKTEEAATFLGDTSESGASRLFDAAVLLSPVSVVLPKPACVGTCLNLCIFCRFFSPFPRLRRLEVSSWLTSHRSTTNFNNFKAPTYIFVG